MFSFMCVVPVFKDYYSSTTCVNPWPSSCPNTNPTRFSMSKEFVGCSINLVIERLGLGFHKTSSFESIQCCLFTGFLCIRICFFVMIEAVDNIYNSKTVYSKSGIESSYWRWGSNRRRLIWESTASRPSWPARSFHKIHLRYGVAKE